MSLVAVSISSVAVLRICSTLFLGTTWLQLSHSQSERGHKMYKFFGSSLSKFTNFIIDKLPNEQGDLAGLGHGFGCLGVWFFQRLPNFAWADAR